MERYINDGLMESATFPLQTQYEKIKQNLYLSGYGIYKTLICVKSNMLNRRIAGPVIVLATRCQAEVSGLKTQIARCGQVIGRSTTTALFIQNTKN